MTAGEAQNIPPLCSNGRQEHNWDLWYPRPEQLREDGVYYYRSCQQMGCEAVQLSADLIPAHEDNQKHLRERDAALVKLREYESSFLLLETMSKDLREACDLSAKNNANLGKMVHIARAALNVVEDVLSKPIPDYARAKEVAEQATDMIKDLYAGVPAHSILPDEKP